MWTVLLDFAVIVLDGIYQLLMLSLSVDRIKANSLRDNTLIWRVKKNLQKLCHKLFSRGVALILVLRYFGYI